jgi:glyoxylase-like metal-dependent hydrolase (beta-lactamase superfamily II)
MAATVPFAAFGQNTLYGEVPREKPVGAGAVAVSLVKTGLYVLSGAGGNSVLRLSSNGLILVDGNYPTDFEVLVKKAQRTSFSEQPVRVLILTDHLEPHSGNNARFVDSGALILAHENAKRILTPCNPLGGKVALPIISYAKDYTLKLGGAEARLLHFGSAHTGGDTVVYFPNQKVVAVGALYSESPDPDYASGGSLVNWGPVLAQVLKLDFDTVVPDKGPVISRVQLEAFRRKLDTLVARATALVRNGVGKDRLMAQLRSYDLDWPLNLTSSQVDSFYSELIETAK